MRAGAHRRARLPHREDVMTIGSSAPRSLLLAGAVSRRIHIRCCCAAARYSASSGAAAPSAAAPALPPGSPLFGRPAGNEAAAKLAPVAPPPIAAAPNKLPLAKLKVPAGFQHRSLCRRHGQCAFAGRRRRGRDIGRQPSRRQRLCRHQQGRQASVKTLASGLHRPNGIAFKNGTLYIAELSKVSKVDKIEDNLDSNRS